MPDHAVRTQGRPRQFSVDDAIDAALDLFWGNGFTATTTRELEAVLGISQSSIYNAFGSKRELLLAAIDQYERRVQQELLGILAGPGDGIEVLDEFFRELGRWIERTDHRGCLVVNLMAAESDPAIMERVVAYRTAIRGALANALARSFDQSTAEARADMLLATVLGLHITARTGQEGEVAGMIAAIETELDAWRAAATDR